MGFKFSVCRQLLHLLQTKLYYNQQCLALTTEASPTLCVHPDIPEEHYILLYDVDSELTIVKVLHIYPPGQGQGHSWRRQYDVHVTLPLLQIPSHHHRSQGLIYWILLPQAAGISCNLQLSLCHPSFRLCWSTLSSVKHACITILLISTTIALCTLLNTSYFMAWHYHHKPES